MEVTEVVTRNIVYLRTKGKTFSRRELARLLARTKIDSEVLLVYVNTGMIDEENYEILRADYERFKRRKGAICTER